jgi:hypothetical protein
MTILTEDWQSMEAIIGEHEYHPITVKDCPDAISVSLPLCEAVCL